MEWNRRKLEVGSRKWEGKPRATWAAMTFALASLIVDVSGWIKTDLKPLMELSRQNAETLKRIEAKLEDHERRIIDLERRKK